MNNIKKEVKKKINEYSKKEYLNGYIENEFLTDNGDANIYMKLQNKEELFDERTIGNQKDLNSEVYEFLDSKSAMLPSDIQVNFYILGLNLTRDEKELVRHLIKEHYAIELFKTQKEHKRFENKIYKLLFLGMVFAIFYAIIELNFNSVIFSEILIFLASFTIWEALDFIIYDLNDIKLERKVITQKLLADIYFKEGEN